MSRDTQMAILLILGTLLVTCITVCKLNGLGGLESPDVPQDQTEAPLRKLRGETFDGMLSSDMVGNADSRQLQSLESMEATSSMSIGRHYVDLNVATLSMSGTASTTYSANRAIDGNPSTYAQTTSSYRPWWQADLGSEVKISAVEITPQSTSIVPLTLSVDGVVCATITHFWAIEPKKVPCSAFGQTLRIYLSDQSSTSRYLRLIEVRVEVEGDGMLVPAAHKIICPFLSTLVNEHVLAGCTHSRAKLLQVTIAAGLSRSLAKEHVDSNFRNLPEDFQNICDMEGAMNEHQTSTGINDCVTTFTDCSPAHAGKKASCRTETRDKFCGAPKGSTFESFFDTLDANSDSYLSIGELENATKKIPFNDANPVAEGTIEGSFGLLLNIFGDNGIIHKVNLQRLILERRFPAGYIFGRVPTPQPTPHPRASPTPVPTLAPMPNHTAGMTPEASSVMP